MTATKLGIWMDHERAYLTEFTTDPMKTTIINSRFDRATKDESITHGESGMHDKQQHWQKAYYKKLAEQIRRYQEVLVFGPTHAKNELVNLLHKDHLFDGIKIAIEPADKMTEAQIHAFVRKRFSRH